MRVCVSCSEIIPEGRLKVLPNTKVCTKCSSTEKVKGITITVGEGDHTYNDLVIVDDEQFKKITAKPKIIIIDGSGDESAPNGGSRDPFRRLMQQYGITYYETYLKPIKITVDEKGYGIS